MRTVSAHPVRAGTSIRCPLGSAADASVVVTETLTEPTVVLDVDLDATVPCIVGSHPASKSPLCESQAKWIIRWQCGCRFVYCTQHKDYKISRSVGGHVYCGVCAEHPHVRPTWVDAL